MSPYYSPEQQSAWWDAAMKALSPGELAELAEPLPGEGRVEHAVRIAGKAKRADTRRCMLTYLAPAARDGHRGAITVGISALGDPSRHVRYEACRLMAVAQDRSALPTLKAMQEEGVDVPWQGIEGAILALERGDRNAFFGAQGLGNTRLVLQDEGLDGLKKA